MATSSVVTWYGGDLVSKACKTYWGRPGGRCLGLSSYGLAHGFQRTTVTRGLAAGRDRFEERSRYNSLSPSGSVGLASHWGGTNSDGFEGSCLAEREFLFENLVIGAFARSLSDGGSGVVYPYPGIDTFDAAVTARVVGAYREFVYIDKFVSGCRKRRKRRIGVPYLIGELKGLPKREKSGSPKCWRILQL